MGGINPERPKRGLIDVTQQFTKALFKSASKFFETHALLEDAVIGERSESQTRLTDIIESAETTMSEAAQTLGSIVKEVERQKDTIREELSWHNVYFEIQLDHVAKLKELAEIITLLLQRKEMIDSAKKGNLQESLWHEGVNHEVRIRSIEFLNELMKTLQVHIEFVEATNKKSLNFIA